MIIIGEIVQTYINEEYLTNLKLDIEKIEPIIFSGYSHYLNIGEVIAEAYKIGIEIYLFYFFWFIKSLIVISGW